MDAFRLGQVGLLFRVFLSVALALATSSIVIACSAQPDCPAGLHPYKDKCLTNMAIQYVGCTEGKGISPTTEISAGVGGTLKAVTDASISLAYKRVEQENTPVALQIVSDCLEIAKSNSPPDDPEQGLAADIAADFQRNVIAGTPSITLSAPSARKGESLTVAGSHFWPTEMVSIMVHASLIAQVQADGNGAFSTVITVPPDAPPPGFSTTIIATGQSSAKSAQAPFQTQP